MLKSRNIIVGISGGIAAYKSAYLVRQLVNAGANVKVVMTANAQQFVTKMTFETLSKNPVYFDVFDKVNDYFTEHISITDWADILIVAPATANIIGKYANGIADDALSTTLLAFNKTVFIAPAMNCKMYENFAVQNNISFLKKEGVQFIDPAYGDLACGYNGKGRMVEPDKIVEIISAFLKKKAPLKGKKILITAGPTYEAIDPVRFIGNHSSGKMGYAIAEVAYNMGAEVTLISGPTALKIHDGIRRIDIISAEQMYQACTKNFIKSDITIMSAAIADYTPEYISDKKIKKSKTDNFSLPLKPTKDILKSLGDKKTKSQVLVGFALETEDLIANAKIKLHNKNLDFIVCNTLKDKGAGFGTETNKISIIEKSGKMINFDLKTKKEVARDILEHLAKTIKAH